MTKRQLVDRWTERHSKRITLALERGMAPSDLQVIEYAGKNYLDLRGVNLTRRIRLKKMIRWDLSHCYFDGTLEDETRIENCRFVSTHFEGNIASRFQSCDFSRARIKGGVEGLFEKCCFNATNLTGSDFRSQHLRFIDCDFTNAILRTINLHQTIFENCVWTKTRFGGGSANGTRWIGTRPTDAQLGDTFIMTAEEAEREKQIEAQVEAEIKQEQLVAKRADRGARSMTK